MIIEKNIKSLKDNPESYWFKRKLYGYEWTPVLWQGWFVTILYSLFILFFGLTINENSSAKEIVFNFIIPTLLLTIVLIRIAYKKGEKPRWQWGNREIKK